MKQLTLDLKSQHYLNYFFKQIHDPRATKAWWILFNQNMAQEQLKEETYWIKFFVREEVRSAYYEDIQDR